MSFLSWQRPRYIWENVLSKNIFKGKLNWKAKRFSKEFLSEFSFNYIWDVIEPVIIVVGKKGYQVEVGFYPN